MDSEDDEDVNDLLAIQEELAALKSVLGESYQVHICMPSFVECLTSDRGSFRRPGGFP